MKRTAVIEIKRNELEKYERLFSYGEDDLVLNDIPTMANIKTFTTKFDDGCEVDIKINSSDDDIWSEAVLFDSNGCEIVHTDVCDSLGDVWSFYVDDDTYEVEIKPV